MRQRSQQPTQEPAVRPSAAPGLDPQDWAAFSRLCHKMLDVALGHQREVRERPVWQAVPESVKCALAEPPPLEHQGLEAVCADFQRLVLPYGTGNLHPRFFGWVHGCGTPGGMLAELLSGAMNANLGGRDHGPVYVERQVIEWCRRIFGFPRGAGGLLVSGTSMATLIALTAARNHMAGNEVREEGLAGAPLVAYASEQAHGSVAKALELLGLGRRSLRRVAVLPDLRMDLAALKAAVARDRAAGLKPFCVVATAGTVNTGAIDDLAEIAVFCAEAKLWLHVDGAFGAAAILAEGLASRLRGIERADSLAFDFHKWLHVPYDAGCVLLRDGERQRQSFASQQAYLATASRGLAGGEPWFCDFGPELSRGFRALKVWFTFKEHGLRKLGAQIEENCRQARYLRDLVTQQAALELLAPVSLNIVCFRHRGAGLATEALDQLNGELVVALQERGIAAPSTTRLGGCLAIRVNITNHRTRTEDLDLLVGAILAIGQELASRREFSSGSSAA